MFEASYQPVSPEHPEWGRVAVLPWDAKIFGFPVGDYQAGDSAAVAASIPAFSDCLSDWASANAVELIACSVPATDMHWYTLLPALDFAYVDYTLKIYTNALHKQVLPEDKHIVRLTVPEDQPSVERIAQQAFRAGRYHADPRFPRELVDLRYKHWLANAFASLGPNSRLYVTGEPGAATSFFHATIDGDTAYISIIAVEPTHQGMLVGLDLCAGVLRDLKAGGIRKMSSKISSLNSGVMNFVAYYAWRFGDPQVVFHWHAPHAPHLLSFESVFEGANPKSRV